MNQPDLSDHSLLPESPKKSPKKAGLLRASGHVGSMTMLSRIVGLVRDVVIARFFGADSTADAFFIAFKIPNFFRRLFAEGAFSQAFIPVLSEYRTTRTLGEVQTLLRNVSGALGSILLLITVLTVIAAPVLTAIFAPGFWLYDPDKFELTSQLIRITFPYLMLISLAGLVSAVLNSYDRFLVPAITPIFLNICLIAAALVSGLWFDIPVFALAWGVLLAGVVQLLFQLPFLARLHLLQRPNVDWADPGVKRILTLMLPAMFGVSVSQINLLLDTLLASFLPTGSISWLYYSDRLSELPLGVFGIAIATVILPGLSRHHASENKQSFQQTLDWALRMVLLVGVPASVALLILAEPILLTLFGYGEMTNRDVVMSAWSLRAYASGLCAFMLIKVLAPAYFSRQDTRTPVRIGIIAMVANMAMNLIFVLLFHHFFLIGHFGLALATALAAYLNAGLLYRGLRKSQVFELQNHWRSFFWRLFLATVAMSCILFGLLLLWQNWLEWGVIDRAWRMAVICLLGFCAYLAALFMSGMRLSELRSNTPV